MAMQVDREYAYVNDDDAVPGYLYDKTLRKYYARKDGKQIETESKPPVFHIDIWNFKQIKNTMNMTPQTMSTWQKDFTRENSEDVILVRGSKILEEKGIDPPLDGCMHTVTSVLYKSCLDMLVIFSQKTTDESIKELEEYLNSVLDEENESFIPLEIRKHFNKAYIYRSYSEPGTKLDYSKRAFEEFCLALKNSKTSTIPVQAVIESPKPDPPDAVIGAMNVDNDAIIATPTSGFQNNLDNRGSINSSGKHSKIAETHLPYKCAEEELNLNLNRNVQSCEVNGVLCASKLTEMASEDRKLQVSGSENVFIARREIGQANGSGNFWGGTDVHVGQPQAKSGTGRGFGTRIGRGKPSAPDLLSVGRVTQKNDEDFSESSINSNMSPHNSRSGSQGTIDYIRKSALHSSQSNQIQKVQNQAQVSRVQEFEKASEESDGLGKMTDHNSKKLLFPNEAEKQDKPQGVSQSSVCSGNSTLLNDAQPTGRVTTVSILFSSHETNQRVHQTSESHKEMVSCTKGYITNNSHCLETSNEEKLEETEKTKCKGRDRSSQDLKFEEIDKLVKQNLREISHSEGGSNTERNEFGKDAQTTVHQAKPAASKRIFPTPTPETDPKKVRGLDSHHSGKANKTEHGVGQESLVQKNKESGGTFSDGALKGSLKESETVRHNNNEMKSKKEKGNLKKDKNSVQSYPSYSSVVTQQDHLSTGSGNKKAKQNKFLQDLGNDEEMVDLKSTKNVCHTKQKQKLEKDRNMKTKLLNPVKITKDACGLERKYFGTVNENVPEKVLILLGASGSGKTTLLNFIANYFHGNKNAVDDLIHVENTSQTSAITAYTFCSSVEDIPITVIDTPGLNDSSGGEVRDHVQSLKTFLANAASKNVDVHAIGFVAQAHLVRLTSSERLVMDYVSTMFGQNVSEHLITLVTFADTQDTPPVIEAMKNYKVNFKLFLKFNNSTLSNGKADEVDDLDRVYYRVCWRNWKKCLKSLKDLPPLSVNAMKAVQSEIYATTVIEKAEKDLRAELQGFFSCYKKEQCLSKQNLQVCEQIWDLATVLHRVKSVQDSLSKGVEDILVESAIESCKTLGIAPETYVNLLSLAPSKSLTVAGAEIIRTMAQVYTISENSSKSKPHAINITETAYCHNCSKEHKLKRNEMTWMRKNVTIGTDVLCLKCVECNCPANVHGIMEVQSAVPQPDNILLLTKNSLCKTLQRYSLPRCPVQEESYLKHLNQYLSHEYDNFIKSLLKIRK